MFSVYQTAPMSGGVATMLYGSAAAQVGPEMKMPSSLTEEEMVKEVMRRRQGKAKGLGSVMEMFGGAPKPPKPSGLVSQLASAGLNEAIPGMATQNSIINGAVGGVMKKAGSMNVPYM
jgi:hypothetical protein